MFIKHISGPLTQHRVSAASLCLFEIFSDLTANSVHDRETADAHLFLCLRFVCIITETLCFFKLPAAPVCVCEEVHHSEPEGRERKAKVPVSNTGLLGCCILIQLMKTHQG